MRLFWGDWVWFHPQRPIPYSLCAGIDAFWVVRTAVSDLAIEWLIVAGMLAIYVYLLTADISIGTPPYILDIFR